MVLWVGEGGGGERKPTHPVGHQFETVTWLYLYTADSELRRLMCF
jgi:hypothetical protein